MHLYSHSKLTSPLHSSAPSPKEAEAPDPDAEPHLLHHCHLSPVDQVHCRCPALPLISPFDSPSEEDLSLAVVLQEPFYTTATPESTVQCENSLFLRLSVCLLPVELPISISCENMRAQTLASNVAQEYKPAPLPLTIHHVHPQHIRRESCSHHWSLPLNCLLRTIACRRR